VTFRIRRMSLGRRIELTRKVREISGRLECLEAGRNLADKVEASLVFREIERVYLEWGLAEVHGLSIDGRPATVPALIEAGPEDLCLEILEIIKSENHLNEQERKN